MVCRLGALSGACRELLAGRRDLLSLILHIAEETLEIFPHVVKSCGKLADLILGVDAEVIVAEIAAIDALACAKERAERVSDILREYRDDDDCEDDDDNRDDDHRNEQLMRGRRDLFDRGGRNDAPCRALDVKRRRDREERRAVRHFPRARLLRLRGHCALEKIIEIYVDWLVVERWDCRLGDIHDADELRHLVVADDHAVRVRDVRVARLEKFHFVGLSRNLVERHRREEQPRDIARAVLYRLDDDRRHLL